MIWFLKTNDWVLTSGKYFAGSTPYGGLNWTMGFADEIRNGTRLSIPQFASDDV